MFNLKGAWQQVTATANRALQRFTGQGAVKVAASAEPSSAATTAAASSTAASTTAATAATVPHAASASNSAATAATNSAAASDVNFTAAPVSATASASAATSASAAIAVAASASAQQHAPEGTTSPTATSGMVSGSDMGSEPWDRCQITSEGFNICLSGWERYRVRSAQEVLQANTIALGLIRRYTTLVSSQSDFKFYISPLMHVMASYCLILPASEGTHDVAVGGLVKHNLQVSLIAIQLLRQSSGFNHADTNHVSTLDEHHRAAQEAQALFAPESSAAASTTTTTTATTTTANTTTSKSIASTGERESADKTADAADAALEAAARKEDDTLARFLAQLKSSAATGRAFASESHAQRYRALVIKALQRWREELFLSQHGRFNHKQLDFLLEVTVLFLCCAHDLGKLLYDVEIVADSGKRYNPYAQTLAQFCATERCAYLYVRHIAGRETLHTTHGYVDGCLLLGKFCPQVVALISQLLPVGSLSTAMPPALQKLLDFADAWAASREESEARTGRLFLPTFLNVLLARVVQARLADGYKPNTPESDIFVSGQRLILQTHSRALALFSLWLQEQELGSLEGNFKSDGRLWRRCLVPAHISPLLSRNKDCYQYFLVTTAEGLVVVRGVDFNLSGVSYEQATSITRLECSHPLLAQALLAIVLHLGHGIAQDEAWQAQKSKPWFYRPDDTEQALLDAEAHQAQLQEWVQSQETPELPSAWEASLLQRMDFTHNQSLELIMAHAPSLEGESQPEPKASAAPSATPEPPAAHSGVGVGKSATDAATANAVAATTTTATAATSPPPDSVVSTATLVTTTTPEGRAQQIEGVESQPQPPSSPQEQPQAEPVAGADSAVSAVSAVSGDDAAVAEASRAADASADVSASAPDAATAAATNTAVPVHSGESGESGESASSSEQGYSAQGTPSQVAIPALRWDNLIIKDLALSDFSTMLKDKVSLEALEQGTKYKRALVCFPHKLVLRSGQSAAERHWEVYFGYDDGDFKDFCLERNQQRTKQNNARLKEVRTLGQEGFSRQSKELKAQQRKAERALT